jgi:hypothetical protein
MLMPGDELAQHRAEAQRFQQTFAQQFDRLRTASVDGSNYVTLNRSTVELVKPFIEWKRRLGEAQAKGTIRSLVWPDFFDHTALEAERFTRRLEQFSRGNPELDRNEVIEFWAKIMEDHAEFIAHLLDPQEKTLIAASRTSADMFGRLRNTPDAKVKALAEGQAMVLSLSASPAADGPLLAGTTQGLRISRDGGTTWRPVANLPDDTAVTAVSHHASDARHVYAYVHREGAGLMQSTDGGTTWKRMGLFSGAKTPVVALAAGQGEHAVIATIGADIARSRDGGRTWETLVQRGRPVGGGR